MLFNVICNNFQYSYQSQFMIFDIPLIYNIFSKARNHIDITHPYNFPSISKIFFSRWKLYFIAYVIALHFFSFYYFSFRWNVEKIEKKNSTDFNQKHFVVSRSIMVYGFKTDILYIELQLHTMSTFIRHYYQFPRDAHLFRWSNKRVTLFSERWNSFATVFHDRSNKI